MIAYNVIIDTIVLQIYKQDPYLSNTLYFRRTPWDHINYILTLLNVLLQLYVAVYCGGILKDSV